MTTNSKSTKFAFRVQKNSVEIARQLGFVDDDGNVKPYGAAKVRKALKTLAESDQAVHEGAFRTSTYRLP